MEFSDIMSDLQAVMSFYDGIVFSDETIKDSKKDSTALNKTNEPVEDARKANYALCLESHEAIESKIKVMMELKKDV